MDVNEELRFLSKFKKNIQGVGGGGSRGVCGSGGCERGRVVGGGGVRVDVNKELRFL